MNEFFRGLSLDVVAQLEARGNWAPGDVEAAVRALGERGGKPGADPDRIVRAELDLAHAKRGQQFDRPRPGPNFPVTSALIASTPLGFILL